MRAPQYGGFTTQQPSDLAWASSSSLTPFLYSPPACLSVNPSNTITQLRKREKEARGGGGGYFYNGTLVFITLNEGGWLGERHFSRLRLSYFSCISVEYSLFLPPLGIFTFCLVFLYLNLYLLFRLLLNLSVISKRKKINKKNTKCLKILYRHRF